tara:strand:- start:606 stop:827 length:222 start_codon:yes stop_codon:yes gene_type:complete
LTTDAPSHGTSYHYRKYDNYPNQPNGILEEKMKKLANLKNKNVYFTAIKLCDETNRMYKIMETAFGPKFESTD